MYPLEHKPPARTLFSRLPVGLSLTRARHDHTLSQVAKTLPAGAKALDLGGAKNRYRDLFQMQNWIGLDIRTQGRPTLVADAHALPFREASFDMVLSTQVLEHCRQPWVVTAQVARVLKPGGTWVCTVPTAYPLHDVPWDFYRYTPFGLEALFSPYGEVAVHPYGGRMATVHDFLFAYTPGISFVTDKLLNRYAHLVNKDQPSGVVALLKKLA